MNRLLPAAFGLLLVALSSAATLAQTAPPVTPAPVPLLTHPIRTIDPTDADFADLEFLRQEIGGARVVMLGEPTHGEGNVTEAKIRLIRFLKERMGFTTVAFESGFYELDRAQREMEKGASSAEVLDNSVFSVWKNTQEFQAILPLISKGGLKVAGFDGQLSGAYQDELLEELEAFLKPEKGADGIAYDYLDECVSMMGEHFIFPPANSLVIFNLQMSKARRLLEKVAAGPDAKRRERAAFWLQNLRSLQAMARDYATNDPAVKDSAQFKAVDSNPRDAQMADNLLWYMRQHPQEKVICWAALLHVANRVEVLADADIQTFRPMGRAVKAALGEDNVYVLGTLAGGGEYGFGPWGRHTPVPVPVAGTLEAALLAQEQAYSFISLKHDAAGKQFTTYAFEYKPLTGAWSQAVDGFLFLRTVNPPHARAGLASGPKNESAPADTLAPARFGGRINPAAKPVAGKTGGAVLLLSGVVLDRKTGRPMPFATIAVPARSAGTITDAQGKFRLETRRGELVQISSIGYEPATLAAAPGAAATVRLAPAAFALADVRVSAQSQDPKRIMKKVIQAMPQNYDLGEQTARVYEHRQISNFDTVRLDGEFVMNMLVPIGFQQYQTFLRQQPFPEVRVQEARFSVRPPASAKFDVASISGHGMTKDKLDVIRLSKLFQAGSLNRYVFRLDTLLQQGAETTYVIAFKAKKANKRTIGSGLQAGYQGRLFVLQSDYAVTRYEALWQGDTAWYNAAANKYHGRNNIAGRIFVSLYSDWRNAHVATYAKWADGRYRLTTSTGSARALGRNFKTGPFYYQSECFFFFQPLPNDAIAPAQTLGVMGETAQGLLQQEHPEFWQTYQRPVPAAPASALEATRP